MTKVPATQLWTISVLPGLLLGCSSGSAGSPDERPRVVATTTQVGVLAGEIGGSDIALTVLLQPGIEAHDFELTPAHGAALEQSELILQSGAGLESWLEDVITTIGASDRVRDMSAGIELRTAADEGHADEGYAEDVDPHYWLSAPNAVGMARNVERALAELLPEHAEDFGRRADAVVARLERAHAEIRRLFGAVPRADRKLVSDHDALGYFIDEYGLVFVGSVFPSLDVSAEPSGREIETLVHEIRSEGVRAIFSESSVNPRLARAVAAETEARLVEEPIYTDSLGPAGSGSDTLDGMLLHNARVIHDALASESQ